MQVLSAATVLFLLIALISTIGLTLFITFAVGLSDIAKDQGEPKHWLAWIPVGNIILIMMLVEKTDHPLLKGKAVIYFGLLVLVSLFTLPLFMAIQVPLLSNPFMPMIIPGFWTLIVYRVLIEDYTEHPTVHMFLGLITMGFSLPFQTYGFRNKIQSKLTDKNSNQSKRRDAK